jgi:hypothetical protein
MTERMAVSLRLATLKKIWKYYDNQFIFSDEDLSVMQADLDKQIVSLRKNELTVSSKINRTLDQARTAKSQLEQITQSSTASAEALTQAKNTLRMADIQAEAARMEREKYRALIDLVTIQMQLWKIRHDLYTPNQTAANFTIAKTQQLNLVHRLDQGQQYLTQMIAEKSQSSFNISEQLNPSMSRSIMHAQSMRKSVASNNSCSSQAKKLTVRNPIAASAKSSMHYTAWSGREPRPRGITKSLPSMTVFSSMVARSSSNAASPSAKALVRSPS